MRFGDQKVRFVIHTIKEVITLFIDNWYCLSTHQVENDSHDNSIGYTY